MSPFSKLDRRHRRLYSALAGNFVLFGVTLTIVGAAVPRIVRTFEWSYTLTGIVLAAGSIGYFTSTFLTGLLMHRFTPMASMAAGLTMEGFGLLFFALAPSAPLNMAIMFLVGVGQGIREVVTNFEVVKMEREGESGLMTLLHAFFCLGAVVGPLLVGALMKLETGWTFVFRFCGAVVIGAAVPFSVVPFHTDPGGRSRGDPSNRSDRAGDSETVGPHDPIAEAAAATSHGRVLGPISAAGDRAPAGLSRGLRVRVLFEPLLVLSFVSVFLYVGSELGISNWISEYFVAELGAAQSLAAFMVSVLWAGVLAGRLLIAFLLRRVRRELTLLLCSLGCASFLMLALAFRAPAAAGAALFLTGIGYSGIYPLVMTLVGKRYPEGAALGFISTGGGVGSFVFPFLLAFIADRVGLRGGVSFCAALNVVLVIASALMLLGGGKRSREARP